MMSLDLGESPRMVIFFRLWISELHSDTVIYPEHIYENYEKQTIMIDHFHMGNHGGFSASMIIMMLGCWVSMICKG